MAISSLSYDEELARKGLGFHVYGIVKQKRRNLGSTVKWERNTFKVYLPRVNERLVRIRLAGPRGSRRSEKSYCRRDNQVRRSPRDSGRKATAASSRDGEQHCDRQQQTGKIDNLK